MLNYNNKTQSALGCTFSIGDCQI